MTLRLLASDAARRRDLPAGAPCRFIVLDEPPFEAEALEILRANSRAKEIDAAASARLEAEAFSRDYPDFIARLSAANDGGAWWALSLVGRNPLSSPTPERLFKMRLVADAWRRESEGDLVVFTSDAEFAAHAALWAGQEGIACLNRLRRRENRRDRILRLLPLGPFFAFFRALARWLWVRLHGGWRASPDTQADIVATLLNHQSFDEKGRYRDTYFGDLPARLAESGRRPVVFGAVTHDFLRTVSRARRESSSFPILPMEQGLSPAGMFRVLRETLRLRLFGFPLKGDTRFDGVDARPLLAAEIDEHARRTRYFSDLLFREALSGLLSKVRPARLLFPFENRAWERMLLAAWAECAPGTPSLGYQHATTTPFHLNFKLGRGELDYLPLPDKIVTLGEVTRRRLQDGGFPAEKLVAGCALRQTPVEGGVTRLAASRKLLVALASSVSEYVAVLKLLRQTFPNGGPEIILRPHPVISLDAALARLPSFRLKFTRDPGRPYGEAIEAADAVLFASGTSGLEAVRRGVPAVFLDIGRFLSTDPMQDFNALKWKASDAEELRVALDQIGHLTLEDLRKRRTEGRAYADQYGAPPSPATLAPLLASSPAAPR